MKTRILISSAVLSLSLVACGGSDTGGLGAGTTYTLQSGTFAVSNATAQGNDECHLLPAYQAEGTNLTFTAQRAQ